jgi:alpha,alpha-trehalase
VSWLSTDKLATAAYQVGLSFLTTHMRRAVAACTSPEVFFGAEVVQDTAVEVHDVLGFAMENLKV